MSSSEATVPRGGDTAARLLAAAEAVFAEVGFAGATTAAIAERAGVTKALVHYYFGSKESLHHAVMERYEERLGEPMLVDLEHEEPMAALQAAMRRFCRFMAEHPTYVRLCLYNALEGSRTLADTRMYRRLVEVATSSLQRGMERGIFRELDPRHLIVLIDSMCTHFFEHESAMAELWGDAFDREQVIESHIRHVTHVIELALLKTAQNGENRV
jgi:TetR/AcrR family transcriptional regulator